MSKILEIELFEQLAIFKIFKQKTDISNYQNTLFIVQWCLQLLPQTITTFKKYTVHHSQHQYNILKLYQYILNTHIEKLTDLELQILILSSVLHDIGMVFSEDEKRNIIGSDDFKLFLENNPRAKIDFYNNHEQINENLLVWYCRSTHAKRVYKYLFLIDDKLKYDGYSIREKTGLVCESHNWNSKEILKDEFNIDFIGKADLKFCAILLRLADILDFDYTRSPSSVFDFLEFNDETKDDQFSKFEWLKHIYSDGFKFQKNEILFFAKPNDPKIEYGIRRFINIIEKEIHDCRQLLYNCSPTHKEFILPTKINTKHVISQEYHFGEYAFNVDKNKIINLLMGENIYSDKYSFIRELLQNSIDAINFRKITSNDTQGIINTFLWQDKNGAFWFRIDDNGTGMSEHIIKNYFLKIGRSFYNDDYFNSKSIIPGGSSIYTPISRFGIGILSIFLASDLAIINTYSVDNKKKIRLTIDGSLGYYYYQTEKHKVKSLPNLHNTEELLREQFGTTICVKIRSELVLADFNNKIEKIVKSLTYPSNYNLTFNNKSVHPKFDAQNTKIRTSFSAQQVQILNKYLNISNSDKIEIIGNLVNIENLNDLGIGGFCLLKEYVFPKSIENIKGLEIRRRKGSIRFSLIDGEEGVELDLPNNIIALLPFVSDNELILAFNGIVLPLEIDKGEIDEEDWDFYSRRLNLNYTFTDRYIDSFFVINLSGDSRPDLPISRERLRKFNFTTYSNLSLAIIKTLTEIGVVQNSHFVDIFGDFINKDLNPISTYIEDKSLLGSDGWRKMKVFTMGGDIYSVDALIELINVDPNHNMDEIMMFYNNLEGYFTVELQKLLLDIYFDIEYLSKTNKIIFKEKTPTSLSLKSGYFPPLFSIKYDNSALSHYPLPINNQHQLVQELNNKIAIIKVKYPVEFKELLESMYYFSYDYERLISVLKRLSESSEFSHIDIDIENDFIKD